MTLKNGFLIKTAKLTEISEQKVFHNNFKKLRKFFLICLRKLYLTYVAQNVQRKLHYDSNTRFWNKCCCSVKNALDFLSIKNKV